MSNILDKVISFSKLILSGAIKTNINPKITIVDDAIKTASL